MDNHVEEVAAPATDAGEMKYPHNVLEGFSNGCILDLRMRFAMELLKGWDLYSSAPAFSCDSISEEALSISESLFKKAEARGWVAPIPDDGELNRFVRMQAKRTAKFQALQQVEGQKAMQRENNGAIIEPGRNH